MLVHARTDVLSKTDVLSEKSDSAEFVGTTTMTTMKTKCRIFSVNRQLEIERLTLGCLGLIVEFGAN